MPDSQQPESPQRFEEKLEALRSTDPAMVRWMILQNPKDPPRDGEWARAQAVAYLSMVDIESLFDETFGAAGWRASYPLTGAITICRIELRTDDGEWVAKEDGCGDDTDYDEARKKGRLDMALKANLSDAFKRAARRWGIGRDLASLPKPWVDCRPQGRSWVIADHEAARLHEIAETRVDPGRADRRQASPQEERRQEQRERPRDDRDDRDPPQRRERRDDRRQGGQGQRVWRIPFGDTKGTPIAEAATKDLIGVKRIIEANLENNQSQNPERDEAFVDALEAELQKRNVERQQAAGNGQRRPEPPENKQPAPQRREQPQQRRQPAREDGDAWD